MMCKSSMDDRYGSKRIQPRCLKQRNHNSKDSDSVTLLLCCVSESDNPACTQLLHNARALPSEERKSSLVLGALVHSSRNHSTHGFPALPYASHFSSSGKISLWIDTCNMWFKKKKKIQDRF